MQNGLANTHLSAEEKLTARARLREESAARAIIRQNNRRLFRLARSIVGSDSEAEDAVQESYVRAFTQLDRFRGESSLSTWLTRILINEAYGRLRRRRQTVDWESVERHDAKDAQIIPFPLASQSDPERTMAKNQIFAVLERAIDALPEPFRVVLVARLVEEMSVEQTAEALGLRPEMVKTRLHRARNLLRDRLESQIGPMLTDAFPFAGARCERMAEVVIARLRTVQMTDRLTLERAGTYPDVLAQPWRRHMTNGNPKSTASIGGHPIHPMIIPFPITFLVTAFVTDLVYWANSAPVWASASMWLLGAGVIMALVAAVFGFTDFFGEPRIRNITDAWLHMGGNLIAVVIAAINWYIRYRSGAAAGVFPWGIWLSLITVLLLLFNGWKGWGLIYRHHVAISDIRNL